MALARALAKGAPLATAGRAAGRPGLQVARGTAGRADPAVRAGRCHRGLCHHRAQQRRCCWAASPRCSTPVEELLQYGPTAESLSLSRFAARRARLQRSADEPDRRHAARRLGRAVGRHVRCPCRNARPPRWPVTEMGVRAAALRLDGACGDRCLCRGAWRSLRIAGSDTFVHADTPVGNLVAP
ncbi:hypothetical protein ACTMU2_28735 [Cupriavidus basilensis]